MGKRLIKTHIFLLIRTAFRKLFHFQFYIVGSNGQSKRTNNISKYEAIGLFEKKYLNTFYNYDKLFTYIYFKDSRKRHSIRGGTRIHLAMYLGNTTLLTSTMMTMTTIITAAHQHQPLPKRTSLHRTLPRASRS